MKQIEVLLLCGGGGDEHEVSLVSCKKIEAALESVTHVNLHYAILEKDGLLKDRQGQPATFTHQREFISAEKSTPIDFVIPYFHGYPGETGDYQSLLEIMQVPYLGCRPEASIICFNKITTKMWLDALHIPNTPYLFLTSSDQTDIKRAQKAFLKWGKVFVKASSQGSSVGCYSITERDNLIPAIEEAFNYSSSVLIEKSVQGCRELEVSVYQYDGKVCVSYPGEIITPQGQFYTYEEKYSENSQTTTPSPAKGLAEKIVTEIQDYCRQAFKHLHLRHLARIDFFLLANGQVYMNEINTFPGLNPISMFPKMMEESGHSFSKFLENIIIESTRPGK